MTSIDKSATLTLGELERNVARCVRLANYGVGTAEGKRLNGDPKTGYHNAISILRTEADADHILARLIFGKSAWPQDLRKVTMEVYGKKNTAEMMHFGFVLSVENRIRITYNRFDEDIAVRAECTPLQRAMNYLRKVVGKDATSS
ncbi:MAG: hypothetical protein ABSE71_02165 [Candidatus Micrarchaeaceae archaeon]|nr:hypothetical protein [Candidatus Micrarchaeota archaeon]HII10373.1 hypothetical protein [Candidatus Micrarchaeota archaeon]